MIEEIWKTVNETLSEATIITILGFISFLDHLMTLDVLLQQVKNSL